MTEPIKKPNYFVRILLVLFCIGLSIMIGFNFFYVQPIGELKYGIFILLAILLILVLAESFDSFSLGKLISIKREYENKKEENIVLERKNSDLINQLISISNNQSQKQESTNVYGNYYKESRKNIQQEKSENDNVQELLDRIGNSIVISDIETSIKEELASKKLEIDGDTSKVLLRHLAGTQLLLQFEKIHSVIFGSQLYLLKSLNKSIPDGGIPEFEVFAHFEKVKQKYSDSYANWDSEQYLGFLYAHVLIIKAESDIIKITNMGVEYLTWITRNGLSEDRPL